MITTQRKITIGIVSPFNPSEFSTYFDKKYQYKVYDNGVCATSVNSLVHVFLKLGYRVIFFTYDRLLKTSVEYHRKLLDVYIYTRSFL